MHLAAHARVGCGGCAGTCRLPQLLRAARRPVRPRGAARRPRSARVRAAVRPRRADRPAVRTPRTRRSRSHAVKAGAQDCLVISELDPALLRRALTHAIERKRTEAALAHQALHDQLTGLPNRALFLDRLGVALDRARRSGSQLAVMFLDFDNFKEINDSRGHAVGDRLLADARRAAGHAVASDGHRRAVRRRRVHVPVRGPHERARGRADRRPHLPGGEPPDRRRRARADGHGQRRDRDGRRSDRPRRTP